ncbi:uncharacterized protein LOC106166866 [Lingula anatina]|uniref:Uncharacterized protein LOC106166866 n=1 Tax=Lingula anatina TaxID=7574 RepID=A0A1S3ISS2_LINAN|nr:uncharacterized protein LOC106166866 [Lingula anatina]|eukprot:XP_013400986.1 uncharacterized protein LOC106166866 [Lingula anatina]
MADRKPQARFVMDKPLPLITACGDGRKFTINEEAKKCLLNIDKPMSVVAIVGKYRTGKSYLMNRLYGKNSGFDLGSTVQSKTKGIWIWARPHPRDSNRYMLLIDTEGLYDVEKGDSTYDTQLFTLAVLLCNCFVYNSQGTIDDDAIRKLHLVAELTEHIKVQAGNKEETGESFSKYFPQFIWAVRDFALQLEIDGRACTSDEYLEHALQLKKGKSRAVFDFNAPRECIRTFFPQRKCFVLQKPVEDEALLHRLDQANDGDIRPGFLREAQRFCEAVWTGVDGFTVQGNTINGRRYVALAETYVQAINSGAVPCIGTAVETMMQVECQRALEESVKHYRKTMEKTTVPNMPLFLHELSSLHEQANEEALRVYKGIAVFDAEGIFHTKLQEQLLSIYDDFVQKNKEASRKKCKSILQNAYADIASNIQAGHYAVKGGYKKYQADYQKVKEIYANTQRKGPCADEELARFNEAKICEGKAIMTADKAMSQKEKDLAEAREKQQQEALRSKSLEEQQVQLQQQLIDKEKSNLAMMQKVQAEFDEKIRATQERHEEDIRTKDEEHQRLLQEGLHTQAEQHKEMLDEMRQNQRELQEQYQQQVDKMNEDMLRQENLIKEIKENPPKSGGGIVRSIGEVVGQLAREPGFTDKPVLFIGTSENGKLEVSKDAITALQNIDIPVSVISVTGKYRTGKSYLMNLLFGESNGFALGSTIQSKTKGIWLWYRPYPGDSNRGLVLLDTEGLSDPEKGNENHDNQIFALAVLLSSCLVYNSMGTISEDAIRSLHFITSLTEHIKLQNTADEETGENFDDSFPFFVWVVRDFALELQLDGKPCTEDEYLERALQLKPGKSRAVRDYNFPRECIGSFFSGRKCFTLCRPVEEDSKLQTLDTLNTEDLKPQFVKQSEDFKNWILEQKMQMNVGGCIISGRRLLQLAQSYVGAINDGAVPCVQSAVTVMGRNECERAIDLASNAYMEEMDNALGKALPVDIRVLSEKHKSASDSAVKLYHANAMLDSDGQYSQKLQDALDNCYRVYTEKNWQASVQKCDLLLKALVQESLKPKLDEAAFSVSGGYEKYRGEIDTIVMKFERSEGKGPAAEELLAKFLAEKQDQEEAILAGDKAMTKMDREKAEVEEEAKRQAADAAAKSREAEMLKQQLLDVENSMQTNMTMLKGEFEKKLQETEAGYKALLAKRQAEHEELLKSELKTQAQLLEKSIKDVKEEHNRTKENMEETISTLKTTMEKRQSQLAEISQQPNEADGTGSRILTWMKENPETLLEAWNTITSFARNKSSASGTVPDSEAANQQATPTMATASEHPAGGQVENLQSRMNSGNSKDQSPPGARPPAGSLNSSKNARGDEYTKGTFVGSGSGQPQGAIGNDKQPHKARFLFGRAGFPRDRPTLTIRVSPFDQLLMRQTSEGSRKSLSGQGNKQIIEESGNAAKLKEKGKETNSKSSETSKKNPQEELD